MSVEKKLAEAGIFAGHQGLRGFAECDAFWEQLPYGKRLYYNDGEYLHRDVLRAAIKVMDKEEPPR